MLKNWKIVASISTALWIIFILHIIAIEVIHLEETTWVITGAIVAGCLVGFHVYFIYVYLKNLRRVKDLQEQYIETLKPVKPLRFCPSDDELVGRHYEMDNEVVGQIEIGDRVIEDEVSKESTQENENNEELESI